MRKGLVIFDCDGVLVDSELTQNRVLAEALSEHGLVMTSEEATRTFSGGTGAATVAKAEGMLGRRLPADFMDAVDARAAEVFREELQAVDGVRDVVEHVLSIGLLACVASNGHIPKMELTLGVTGLLPYFEGKLFCASHVPRPKPHPDLFLYAAERMGVSPARCIVIEDSLFGVQGGLTAGMTVLAFAPHGDADAFERLGARPFSHMHEVSALVAQMLS